MQVFESGGTQPRCSRDGRELFYVQSDTLMRVPVTADAEFRIGGAAPLFSHPGLISSWPQQEYDVSPDGQRFVLVKDLRESSPSIEVVQNWFAEFRHREKDLP